MNRNVFLFFLISICPQISFAQVNNWDKINIGDPAPPLLVDVWLKGKPVKPVLKGKVFVIEFWATWCKPCIEAMPHLSKLANDYENKIIFVGVDVYEEKNKTPFAKVGEFVSKMGNRMNYRVAVQQGNLMEQKWMAATGETGIPVSFVVNKRGKIAWIGHPISLTPAILDKVIADSLPLEKIRAERILDAYLRNLDDSLKYDFYQFVDMSKKGWTIGQPDAALHKIDEILAVEPRLKYAYNISWWTFTSLIKSNQQHAAYLFGKELASRSTIEDPSYDIIFQAIDINEDHIQLSPEIYGLGIECYDKLIGQIAPKNKPRFASKFYSKKADYYLRSGNRLKSLEMEEEAIKLFREQDEFSSVALIDHYIHLQKLMLNDPHYNYIDTSARELNSTLAGTKGIEPLLTDHLLQKDDSLKPEMLRYFSNPAKRGQIGHPDSLLMSLEQLLRIEPDLTYAPNVANWTFNSLIETNQQKKAYDYAEKLLSNADHKNITTAVFVWSIDYYKRRLAFLPALYDIGIQACQILVNSIPEDCLPNYAPIYYQKMAAWHWQLGRKSEAIQAQENAIRFLKTQKQFPVTELQMYESELRRYMEN